MGAVSYLKAVQADRRASGLRAFGTSQAVDEALGLVALEARADIVELLPAAAEAITLAERRREFIEPRRDLILFRGKVRDCYYRWQAFVMIYASSRRPHLLSIRNCLDGNERRTRCHV